MNEARNRLVGVWRVTRRISGGMSMTGTARITALGSAEALHEEQGRLRLADGQELDAARRYLFRFHEAGFNVHFQPGGALFHEVRLRADRQGALRGGATHRCGADRYESFYALGDDAFVIRHRVTGPRKGYTMTTRYLRAGD